MHVVPSVVVDIGSTETINAGVAHTEYRFRLNPNCIATICRTCVCDEYSESSTTELAILSCILQPFGAAATGWNVPQFRTADIESPRFSHISTTIDMFRSQSLPAISREIRLRHTSAEREQTYQLPLAEDHNRPYRP